MQFLATLWQASSLLDRAVVAPMLRYRWAAPEVLAAQAKVATVQAQAAQQVAQADGKAKALDLEGEAIRRNPEVLRIRAIEKWDGKLPQVTSGGVPFINVEK